VKEAMKEIYKLVGGWFLGLVMSLYITFVMQTLWNWFVPSVLHADSISYWNMYGLLLIVTVVKMRNASTGEAGELYRAKIMLEACLPDEKREETMRAIEKEDIGSKMLRYADGFKLLGATVWLAIGFAVHAFLM
jgi:hypothetical protein